MHTEIVATEPATIGAEGHDTVMGGTNVPAGHKTGVDVAQLVTVTLLLPVHMCQQHTRASSAPV